MVRFWRVSFWQSKLYTTSAHLNQHADLIMITASLCGAKIEEVVLNSTDAAALFSKVGTGATLPVLETESGEIICQTPAILQYIAHGSDLLGKSQFEKAAVL